MDSKTTAIMKALNTRVQIALILAVGLGVTGIALHFLLPFAFIFLFSTFDYLGYYNVLNHDPTNPGLGSYRIMESLFQFVGLTLVFAISAGDGLGAALIITACAELLHLSGNADLLFYWLADAKLDQNWNWLYWTPIGWFWNKQKPIPLIVVKIQALVGLILAILLFIA